MIHRADGCPQGCFDNSIWRLEVTPMFQVTQLLMDEVSGGTHRRRILAGGRFERGIDVPPSGRRGLMLGEILGLSAGLTCTELLLFLFLLSRALVLDSTRLPAFGPPGDARAPS